MTTITNDTADVSVDYTLKKKEILKKNSDFRLVYQNGKSYANRWMVVYVLPNGQERRRAGFVAGKRLGNAVVRNRIKRLLREAYRLQQHGLVNGVDLIFVGRKAMTDATFPVVHSAFRNVCARAKLFLE